MTKSAPSDRGCWKIGLANDSTGLADVPNGLQIGQEHHRVGRCLAVHDPGGFGEGFVHVFRIPHVDERERKAQLLVDPAHQAKANPKSAPSKLATFRSGASRVGVWVRPYSYETVDPLEFLARVLTPSPDTGQVTTRYDGWYATRPRGMRRQAEAGDMGTAAPIVPARPLAPAEARRAGLPPVWWRHAERRRHQADRGH